MLKINHGGVFISRHLLYFSIGSAAEILCGPDWIIVLFCLCLGIVLLVMAGFAPCAKNQKFQSRQIFSFWAKDQDSKDLTDFFLVFYSWLIKCNVFCFNLNFLRFIICQLNFSLFVEILLDKLVGILEIAEERIRWERIVSFVYIFYCQLSKVLKFFYVDIWSHEFLPDVGVGEVCSDVKEFYSVFSFKHWQRSFMRITNFVLVSSSKLVLSVPFLKIEA